MSRHGKVKKGGFPWLRKKLKLRYPFLSDKESNELISKVREDFQGSLSGLRMVDILKSIKVKMEEVKNNQNNDEEIEKKEKQSTNKISPLIEERDNTEMEENDTKQESEVERNNNNDLIDGSASKFKDKLNIEDPNDTQEKEKDNENKNIYSSEKTCKFCFKMFLYKWTCRNHMKQAHDYSDGKVRSLKETERVSNKEKKINNIVGKQQCSVCEKVFLHSCTLKRHMNEHKVSPDIFKCKFCDKTFLRRDKLKRHQQVVHKTYQIDFTAASQENTNSLLCRMCSMNFGDDKERLFAHLAGKVCQSASNNFKLDEKHRFACKYCTNTYRDKDALMKHVRWKHSKEDVYFECTICSSKLKQKSSLVRHMKKFHGGEVGSSKK